MKEITTTINILRYKDGNIIAEEDIVVKEQPLTIVCNNIEIATLLCTPDYQEELAVGFLTASGLIKDATQIPQVKFLKEDNAVYVSLNEENNDSQAFLKRFITTGCGMGTLISDEEAIDHHKYTGTFNITFENVFSIVREMQQMAEVYLATGGVHSAALSNGEKLLVFRDDVGRHNAVDKIIGHALLNSIFLGDKVLITSGRISSEIVLKLARAGIGGIISRSAPMDRAIEYAKKLNMTVIGFVRGNRLNVYCGEERLR